MATDSAQHKLSEVETLGSTKDRKIAVTSTPQFSACISMVAKCSLPVDVTFDLLCHEDNWKFFRAIKRIGSRKVIKDAFGEREVEVEHIAGWRILFMSGEFSTKLRVHENRRSGHIGFRLISSDVMQDFSGAWTVKPFTQLAMDELHGCAHSGPLAAFERFSDFLKPKPPASLLRLEQKIQPRNVPGPMVGLIRKAAAASVKTLLEDLDAEIERIQAGKATIPSFNKYSTTPSAGKAQQPTSSLASISSGALSWRRTLALSADPLTLLSA